MQKTVLTSLSRISIHSTARVETDGKEPSVFIADISIHSTARVET